jgi:hypothetical protein
MNLQRSPKRHHPFRLHKGHMRDFLSSGASEEDDAGVVVVGVVVVVVAVVAFVVVFECCSGLLAALVCEPSFECALSCEKRHLAP